MYIPTYAKGSCCPRYKYIFWEEIRTAKHGTGFSFPSNRLAVDSGKLELVPFLCRHVPNSNNPGWQLSFCCVESGTNGVTRVAGLTGKAKSCQAP